jgi:arsenate reductase
MLTASDARAMANGWGRTRFVPCFWRLSILWHCGDKRVWPILPVQACKAPATQRYTHGMAAPLRIYHNARCSKSRSACALIEASGLEAEVISYLDTPPSRAELEDLLRKLGMKATEVLRRGEPVFESHYAGRDLSEREAMQALLDHPILLERPIVVRGDRAVIARPPERVSELLSEP